MLAQFKEHLRAVFPRVLEGPFLVACSGGLDSVVLARLCRDMGLNFALAHCNFQLRGGDSDADEALVRDLAHQWERPFFVKHFKTRSYAKKSGQSIQMAARELRYQWFASLMEAEGYDHTLTAHHADDTLETMLINLSRGTGIQGLMGIPPVNGAIVRPLLPFSRDTLAHYAKGHKVVWREDASNAETKYLRNKIRLQIVPLLKQLHPTFLENVTRTQNHLRQTEALTEAYTRQLKERLFHGAKGRIEVDLEALKALEPRDTHLHALFRDYGFTDWEAVTALLDATSGKRVRSGTHLLLKDRDALYLDRANKDVPDDAHYSIAQGNTHLEHPVRLTIATEKELKVASKNIIYVDKSALKFPLRLRKWKNGDYFYPIGMKGRKKLAKFFKDEKMNLFEKEDQWLLCSESDIVWVVGRRMDERFKVKESTEDIISIAYTE
ncbi:tRNA lysidine(34) synthetase TilS [Maribacter sp. 2307ULW6-5]